ncbi:MAG: hypothetical protein P4L83_00525 [Nevskia sp.]|nr:hypothetical protein [Nevskia sp.]
MKARLRWFASGLDALFNRHRFMRRLSLLWAMGLVTWTVHEVFTRRPDIPAGTVAALSAVTGLLGSVIGLYQYHRGRDDRRGDAEQKP